MIQYRETLIKNILNLTEESGIESEIDTALNILSENGTHPFIIVRFVDKLKLSLNDLLSGEINETEKRMILKTLGLLENYDVTKITARQTKSK